ncbi:MAG TPA: NlpC/P60 family protein [Candidatus Methylomirabilis sp.]|nr:NlpC/P60 family protein [Candidatus Methylomirabilis sp.]
MRLQEPRVAFDGPERLANAIALGVCLLMTWVCFAGAGATFARAQGTTSVHSRELSGRLLTVEEGHAILNVAWQQDVPIHGVRDCSHLVHEIYANAGFAYPYASSFEIYAGNQNFARVKFARAGDLIAWPGHVGIVVNPAQHSFYSLVRAGLQEMNYESPYWRSRGKPRFYRLKLANTVLTAAQTSARPVTPDLPARDSAMTAGDEQIPAAERPDRPLTATSARKSSIYGPPVLAAPTELPSAVHEGREPAQFEMPANVMVSAGSKAPTSEEVAEAISEFSDVSGSALRTDSPFKMQQPIVIVEQFSVEKLAIKHDRGWARLVVDSRVLIAGGAAHVKRRDEKVRWELRRTDAGWEALPPADRMYVPHDVAVKNLAAQLARMAATDGAAHHDEAVLREEAEIARILNVLLGPK